MHPDNSADPTAPHAARPGDPSPQLAVVVTDSRGVVKSWNEGAERLTGLSAEEMIGQPAWEICTRVLPPGRDPEAVRRRVKTMVGMALSTGQMREGGGSAFRLRRADGSTMDIDHELSVVPIGDGYVIVGVARDTTAPGTGQVHSDTEGEGDAFHQLFMEMGSAVAVHEIITDERGKPIDYRFLEVNPAFEAQTGLRASDIVGKRVLEVIPSLKPVWIERYGRVALTGVAEQFESFNGALGRHYQVKAYSPSPRRFAAVFHDVTELRERTAFAETIVASAGEGLIVYDGHLRITVWNPVMEELTGLPAASVLGREAFEAFPDVMAAGIGEDLRRAMAGDLPTSREFEYTIPGTGRRGWVVQTNRPHRNANDEIVGVVSTVLDVTAKHEIEETRRLSEEQFRFIFDSVGDGVAINDPEGNFIEVNEVACKRLGYSREQFLQLKVEDISSPEVARLVPERLAKIMQGGVHVFETTHVSRDGRKHPTEASARLIEFRGHPAVLAVHRDLTERRRAEDAIRRQGEFLQAILDAIPIPIIAKDRDGRALMCNASFASRAGLEVADAIGKTVGELGVPDTEVHQDRDAALLADGTAQTYEAFMPTPRGVRLHLLHKAPLRDEDGKIAGLVTAAVDIHDRYAAEESLRRSEERFRTLFECAADAIFISDMEGVFIDANQTACERLGCQKQELIGRTVASISPPELPTPIAERNKALGAGGSLAFETVHLARDGTSYPVEMIATLIDLGGQPAVLGIARDISERKRAESQRAALEDQLRQSQKMEGIGQLAGGIAHDFNNLLTAIRGSASLALAALPTDESAREDLQQIEEAADRAAGLTRQLLAFARRTVMQPEIVDVGQVVRRLEPMLRRLIGEDVTLVATVGDDSCCVLADPGQLEQVIVNLAVNARDAMPDGGRLAIEVANGDNTDGLAQATVLSVTDSGMGIDASVLDHIFEPFFTTKGPGRGTGLGLSTAYGIVRQSGGRIEVRSELGHGSTFAVYLPRIQPPAGTDSEPPLEEGAGGGRTGTILVVEDDSGVRRFATRVLEAAGYRVLTASSGAEAIEASAGAHVQLLLTDVVMPGMSGREVATKLASTAPGLRVLYMSGHTDKGIVRDGVLDPNIDFLPKPFTADALLAAVDNAMTRVAG